MVSSYNRNPLARSKSNIVYSFMVPYTHNFFVLFWVSVFERKCSKISTYIGWSYLNCLDMKERAPQCVCDYYYFFFHCGSKLNTVSGLFYSRLLRWSCLKDWWFFFSSIIILSLQHHISHNRMMAEWKGVWNSGSLLSLYFPHFPSQHSAGTWTVGLNAFSTWAIVVLLL